MPSNSVPSSDLLDRHGGPVPRYTSYPTAPHFHDGIGEAAYRGWLRALPDAATLSLYLHIPFCDTLCWYCGCHTKLVARYDPVADYLATLRVEIEHVVAEIGAGRPVGHVHLGGGTPTVLAADDIAVLFADLRRRFDLRADAEIAVEIDPRGLDSARIDALASAGVTRASLGVQDLDPDVQRAINRLQPFEDTARAVEGLRAAGIRGINLDLMYGLPGQTVEGAAATARRVLALAPDRLALFGYAHVPWMKSHQRLIDEARLPGARARAEQFAAAAAVLMEHGYAAIGLDHFARADDRLALAARTGRLRRNFQGYTDDAADALLGFGASAIGALPEGYVQNAVPLHTYRDALRAGRLAVVRGLALDDDDRLRRAAIEQIMCAGRLDIAALTAAFGRGPDALADAARALIPLAADGLVALEDGRIEVRDAGWPFLRRIAAAFDARLGQGEARHSRAV